MTTSNFSDKNLLDLDSKINIYGDNLNSTDKDFADDKTRSVKLSELYHDIKNYVESNLDFNLQVVNVPTTDPKVRLSVLDDNRTFKLDVPSSTFTVDDVNVNITSDEIMDPAGLNISNQKGYNEYSLEKLKWLEAWAERADKSAEYSVVPYDPIQNPAATLDNWNVTAQLHPDRKGDKEPAINTIDGEYIISLINDLGIDLEGLSFFIESLYQANLFNKYHIKVDADAAAVPNAGELIYKPETYANQNEILISEMSYPYNANTTDNNDPDVPNNYLIYNLKEEIVFSINGEIFNVEFDSQNPVSSIERIADPDPDDPTKAPYYKVKVDSVSQELAEGSADDSVDPVAMYKTSADVTDLLKVYMRKDGKAGNTNISDEFTGNINFGKGINLTGEDSPLKIKGSGGSENSVLISKGDSETPVWEDIDTILPPDKFVKKIGDTMTGPLVMDTASIFMEDGDIIFTRTGTEDELGDIDNRFSILKSIAPVRSDTGESDTEHRYGIKVDIDNGNSYKNNFTVGNRNGDIVKITGGVGAQIEFPTSGFKPNYNNTGLNSGVAIRHIPTPSFENSPGDIAVNKEYVDQQDQLILDQIASDGGCITLNGGLLCGGAPHPKFMDAVRTPGSIQYDTLPDINKYKHMGVFPEDNVHYRVQYVSNNRYQNLYKSNFVTGEHDRVGYFNSTTFLGNDYWQRTNINMGAVSHDQKYAIASTNFIGLYTGNDSSGYQSVYEIQLPDNNGTTRQYNVSYGRTYEYHATRIVSTGPMPDNESGYMIGSFYHRGYQNNQNVYNHTLSILKYGDSNQNVKNLYPNGTNYFNTNSYDFKVWDGNPRYEEYFVTTTSRSIRKILKVKFGDTYNTSTLEVFTSSAPDTIHAITYLPRSKRYYLAGVYRGYLTRPYDGPLDDTCFQGAIEFTYPDSYTVKWSWGEITERGTWDALTSPFEFNSEIVLVGYNVAVSKSNPDTSVTETRTPPQTIMIYDGGNEWKKYESYTADDDEWNATPRDYDADQTPIYTYFRRTLSDSPSQYYGDQKILLPQDVIINTPGLIQPYTQPLFWNGQDVSIEQPQDEITENLNHHIFDILDAEVDLSTNTIVRNGLAYPTYNGSVSGTSSFNGAFLTDGWIKLKAGIPTDAVDATYYDFTSFWTGRGHASAYTASPDYDRDTNTIKKIDGVNGVNVKFTSGGISSTDLKRKWNLTIRPVAHAMVPAPTPGSGLGPME